MSKQVFGFICFGCGIIAGNINDWWFYLPMCFGAGILIAHLESKVK